MDHHKIFFLFVFATNSFLFFFASIFANENVTYPPQSNQSQKTPPYPYDRYPYEHILWSVRTVKAATCSYLTTEINVDIELFCNYYNESNACPNEEYRVCTAAMMMGQYSRSPTNVQISIEDEFANIRVQSKSIPPNKKSHANNADHEKSAHFIFEKVARKFFGSIVVYIEYDCESAQFPNQFCHNAIETKLVGFGGCVWKHYEISSTQTLPPQNSTCPNWPATLRVNNENGGAV